MMNIHMPIHKHISIIVYSINATLIYSLNL